MAHLIQVWIDPEAETCGNCRLWGWEYYGHGLRCKAFDVSLEPSVDFEKEKIYFTCVGDEHFLMKRCDACLKAEALCAVHKEE